jgi:hypothetical protein
LPYGICFTDESYQIGLCENFTASPTSFFSGFLGHIIGSMGDGKFIAYRYASAIASVFTILLPIAYYYRRTQNLINTFIMYCAFMFVAAARYSFIFGWDTFSNLAIVITATLAFEFFYSTKRWLLIAMALTSAVACGCRLPDIVIIPLLSALIAVYPNNRTKKQKISDALVYLVIVVAAFVLLIILFYGSVAEYVNAIQSMTVLNGHGLKYIMKRYYLELDPFSCVLVGQVLIYLLIAFAQRYKSFSRKSVFVCFVVLFGLMYAVWSILRFDYYRHRIGLMISAAWVMTLIFSAIANRESRDKSWLWMFIASAVFAVVPVSGTNTGISKLGTVFTFPFILIALPQFTPRIKAFYKIVFIGVVVSAFFGKLRMNTFEDSGILYCDTTPNLQQLSGLKTTKERAEYIENLCNEIETSKRPIAVIGNRSLLFENIYHLQSKYTEPYFWRNYSDDEYMSALCEQLNKENVPTVISVTESSKEDEYEKLTSILSPLGYSVESKSDNYSVFLKQ